MNHYVAILQELKHVAAQFSESLAAMAAFADLHIRDLEEGTRVSDTYESLDVNTVRDDVYEGIRVVEAAILKARAEAIRVMVDEEGLTLTAVAKKMERSRPFITRLYHMGVQEFEAQRKPRKPRKAAR